MSPKADATGAAGHTYETAGHSAEHGTPTSTAAANAAFETQRAARAHAATHQQLAPAPRKFNTKKWMAAECAALQARFQNPAEREACLKSLNGIAQDFNQFMTNNAADFEANLTAELKQDFQENLKLIQEHFSTRQTPGTPLSDEDILLMKNYCEYLNNCVGLVHKELGGKFDAFTHLLNTAQEKSKQHREAEAAEKAARDAETAAAAGTTTTAAADGSAAAGSTSTSARTTSGTTAVPTDTAAGTAIPERDTYQVQPISIQKLQQDVFKLKATTLGLVSDPRRATSEYVFQRVMETCRTQFTEVVALTNGAKRKEPEDQARLHHFACQVDSLRQNEKFQTEIPEELDRYTNGGQNTSTQKEVNNISIFQHALEIVKSPNTNADGPLTGDDTGSIDGEYAPSTELDSWERELALNVLGSHAATQTIRNAKGSKHSLYGDHHAVTRATEVLETSAKMLGALLTLKSASDDNIQSELTTFAERFGLADTAERLNSLPPNSHPEDVKRTFKIELSLEIGKSINNENRTVSDLFGKAQFTRTYENDMSWQGPSREKTLGRSMAKAKEMLSVSPLTNPEVIGRSANRTPIARANRLEMDSSDAMLDKLGLNEHNLFNKPTIEISQELLDDLSLASIAMNDFSLKEDHKPGASFVHHIEQYEAKYKTEGMVKNHDLKGFEDLSDTLIETAIRIRPHVATNITAFQERLENTDLLITANQVQTLVKQIIITTDTVASRYQKPAVKPEGGLYTTPEPKEEKTDTNLIKSLVEAGNKLTKELGSAEARTEFMNRLADVTEAWGASPKEKKNGIEIPKSDNWYAKDTRGVLDKAARANPFRSASYLSSIPGLSHVLFGVTEIARLAPLVLITSVAGFGLAASRINLGALREVVDSQKEVHEKMSKRYR